MWEPQVWGRETRGPPAIMELRVKENSTYPLPAPEGLYGALGPDNLTLVLGLYCSLPPPRGLLSVLGGRMTGWVPGAVKSVQYQ